MSADRTFCKVEGECSIEAVGYIIGQLSAIGRWIRGQDQRGNRVALAADVPEAAIAAFAQWLDEFRPVHGSIIVGPAANDEDV